MFKSDFWNKPITWKGYAKLCGVCYAIFAAFYAAWFGWYFRESISDWFRDRFTKKKKDTAYETSIFEEDDDEE